MPDRVPGWKAVPMEIVLLQGDITARGVDAVVNAANSSLLGGGGVDGAIHRAAGGQLLAACRELRNTDYPDGLPVGQAVATEAFNLPARWVIHTVGPNARAGQTDPELLRQAFANSLAVAEELGAATVAFPAISAGVYGWDAADVARIAVQAVRDHPGTGIERVEFVLFSEPVAQAFRSALADQDTARDL